MAAPGNSIGNRIGLGIGIGIALWAFSSSAMAYDGRGMDLLEEAAVPQRPSQALTPYQKLRELYRSGRPAKRSDFTSMTVAIDSLEKVSFRLSKVIVEPKTLRTEILPSGYLLREDASEVTPGVAAVGPAFKEIPPQFTVRSTLVTCELGKEILNSGQPCAKDYWDILQMSKTSPLVDSRSGATYRTTTFDPETGAATRLFVRFKVNQGLLIGYSEATLSEPGRKPRVQAGYVYGWPEKVVR